MMQQETIFRELFPWMKPTKHPKRRGRPLLDSTKRLVAATAAGIAEGRPMADIAEEHGVSREYIRQLAMKQGIKTPKAGQMRAACSEHLRGVVVDRWRQGMCLESIAKSCRISPERTRAIIAKSGIHIPSTRTRKALEHQIMLGMAEEGALIQDITKAMGWVTDATTMARLHLVGFGSRKGRAYRKAGAKRENRQGSG